MNFIRVNRSKKYLQRIIISFSVTVLLLLALLSGASYYSAEAIVLDMQKQAEKKVLSQIKFNIAYMNEVIQNVVTSLYYDSDVIPLMTMTDDSDVFDTLRKRARIDKFADYTPFIHSIVIYNAHLDRFFWGGDPALQDRDAPIYGKLRSMFQGAGSIPKLEMRPMSMDGSRGEVDFFSIFNYDSSTYRPQQSVFMLNVKPQWLFDNIKMINQLAWQENENVFMMSEDGVILSPDKQGTPIGEEARHAIAGHLNGMSGEAYGSFYDTLGGKKKIVNYMNTGINGWTLISIQPYETLVKKANALKKTSIVVTACFLLFALFAAFGVSHWLYRPLGRLVYSFRRHANEESDGTPAGEDELSYLSGVYQRAIERLQAARNEQITTRSIVRSYYIRKMVTDSMALTEEQLSEWIRQHKLAIGTTGPYLLCVMKLDGWSDSANAQEDNDRKVLQFAVANIAQEMVSQSFACEAVEMKNEHVVAVIHLSDSGEAAVEVVRDRVRSAQDMVAKLYRVTFSAALSESFPDYREMADQYTRGLQILRYKLVFGRQSLIERSMVLDNLNNDGATLPIELERKLIEALKSQQREPFEKALERIIHYIGTLNYDYMMYIALHVLNVMKNVIKEMNDNRIVPLSDGHTDIHQQLVESESLDAMKRMLSGIFAEIQDLSRSPEQERNVLLVDTIKDVIRQNYSDSTLGLPKLAETMKLSADYIGKLFKRHQGIAIAEYINEVRLRQAVALLEQGDCTINELIERIGFGTRSNFFRLFKSKYGTTPKEFRVKRSLMSDKE